MKNFKFLISAVLLVILIVLFGTKVFTHKPKIAPQAPIQLKEQAPDEGLTSENKQTTESPEEPEYQFPLKKGEPLLN